MKKILVGSLSFVLCFLLAGLTACGKDETNQELQSSPEYVYSQFGEFGYNGQSLTDYAVKTITADEAKNILPKRAVAPKVETQTKLMSVLSVRAETVQNETDCLPPEDVVKSVMLNYAGCSIATKYYLEDSDGVQTKTDKIVGTDFKSIITKNQFIPFNQLVAKNMIAFDDLIDYMEEENARFQDSELGLIAPFKTIFSYHTTEDGNLIIQTRDFAEIASSVGGGIGCSYRQDTEIVYDTEGKMILWQTSLGISSSAPQGTMRQGYILEMNVEWVEKI